MIPCKIMMNLAVHILHVFPKKKWCILPLEMKRIETKNSEALENVSYMRSFGET